MSLPRKNFVLHTEVVFLCNFLSYTSLETVGVLSDFDTNKTSLKMGIHLKGHHEKITIYLISSEAIPREFNAMNLYHTNTRNRLKIETVSLPVHCS